MMLSGSIAVLIARIASSASVFADDQRLALASGFSDFLPKPVMEEELFEILGRHLGLKWIYAQESQATNA
jgi:ammonium transporter, Amt family